MSCLLGKAKVGPIRAIQIGIEYQNYTLLYVPLILQEDLLQDVDACRMSARATCASTKLLQCGIIFFVHRVIIFLHHLTSLYQSSFSADVALPVCRRPNHIIKKHTVTNNTLMRKCTCTLPYTASSSVVPVVSVVRVYSSTKSETGTSTSGL